MKNPTPSPAYGTQGRAQVRLVSPSTAETLTCTRPSMSGSMLFFTFPRYFPKYDAMISFSFAEPVRYGATIGEIAPVPSRVRVKLCLYSPREMLCVTLFT